MMYGREEGAEGLIEAMTRDQDPILRCAGALARFDTHVCSTASHQGTLLWLGHDWERCQPSMYSESEQVCAFCRRSLTILMLRLCTCACRLWYSPDQWTLLSRNFYT